MAIIFSHKTTKICRSSYFLEGAIAMSKCRNMPRTQIMGIYGYTGEREQRQQVCVKLSANTSAEALSPRAVVIPVRGMS